MIIIHELFVLIWDYQEIFVVGNVWFSVEISRNKSKKSKLLPIL